MSECVSCWFYVNVPSMLMELNGDEYTCIMGQMQIVVISCGNARLKKNLPGTFLFLEKWQKMIIPL